MNRRCLCATCGGQGEECVAANQSTVLMTRCALVLILFASLLLSACVSLPRQEDCQPSRNAVSGADSWDGFVVGRQGCVYHPDQVLQIDLSTIGVGTAAPKPLVMFVNGAMNSLTRQYQKLLRFAEETNSAYIGIYNNEFFPRKKGWSQAHTHVSAEHTLTQLIHQQLKQNSEFYLLTGSKGTHIVVDALRRVKRNLAVMYDSNEARTAQSMNLIHVITYGGASRHYPDGPKYTHYINRLDPIPWLFGVGALGARPGQDAQVVTLVGLGPLEWNPLSPVHGFRVYLPYFREALAMHH